MLIAPTTPRQAWLAPALLLALTAVPVLMGGVRLVSVSTHRITPDAARWAAGYGPLVLHIVCGSLFAVLGVFQFLPGFRRRWPLWHRISGRVLVVAGIGAAITAIWLTLFYPPGEHDGEVLYAMRLIFGAAMLASIMLGLRAILQRDFAAHQAWMLRGYAIGMGAGTQVLTHLPWVIFVGAVDTQSRTVLMGAAWVINLAVAELLIRRAARPREQLLRLRVAFAPAGAQARSAPSSSGAS